MAKAPGIRVPPPRGSIFRRAGRRRPKLALVARNRHLVKRGARLWDGNDEYRVTETRHWHGEDWAQVHNASYPENEQWFRVADLDELAVIL